MEDTSRIRLLFEDDEEILSPSQKSEGLKQCWLLLKPQQHKTVADFTAYILHAFQLHNSCPHGLYLYMDGFALPPFETTDILKNSDMISVRKKRAILSLEASLEGQEVGGTQTTKAGALLLANKEFQEESGGYLSDELEHEYREPEAKEEADKYVGYDQPAGLEDGANATSMKRKVSEDQPAGLVEGGNATSKKRKASEDQPAGLEEGANLTYKKRRAKKKQRPAVQESVIGDATAKQIQKSIQDKVQSSQENIQKQKRNLKNKKQAKNGKSSIDNTNMEVSTDTKSSDEIQNNANEALEGPVEIKKVSRSARRKKARRQWLRELAKVQKQNEIVQNELQITKETPTPTKTDTSQPESYLSGEPTKHKSERKNRKGERDDGEPKGLLHWKPMSAKDKVDDTRENEKADQNKLDNKRENEKADQNKLDDKRENEKADQNKLDDKMENEKADQNDNIHEQADQHSHTEDEIIPAVVSQEPIQGNRQSYRDDEVVPIVIRPGYIRFEPSDKDEDVEQNKKSMEHFTQWNGITNKKTGKKKGKEKRGHSSFFRDDTDETQELRAEVLSSHNELNLGSAIDFDKLPLCNLPKAGDVIVYRVLELSSSWTPELSPFRVGQVSSYSSETDKLLLMQVPEYPNSSGPPVEEDESEPQHDNSLYKEDGSLEIEFSALVDVRLMKDGSGSLITSANSDAALVVPSSTNDKLSNGDVHPGNGVDIWEIVSEALNAKKAELAQERSGNTWSYRTLKSNALGPTMALLRSNKKL